MGRSVISMSLPAHADGILSGFCRVMTSYASIPSIYQTTR